MCWSIPSSAQNVIFVLIHRCIQFQKNNFPSHDFPNESLVLSINLLRRVVAAPSCFNWILCRSNKFGKAYFEESHTKQTLRFNILLNLVKMFSLYKELLKNSQRRGEFSPKTEDFLQISENSRTMVLHLYVLKH